MDLQVHAGHRAADRRVDAHRDAAAAASADNLDDSGRVRRGGCCRRGSNRPQLLATARATARHAMGVEGARLRGEPPEAGISQVHQPELHGESA